VLFADDTAYSVSGPNDLILWQNICQSIDRILLWFKSNRLTANSKKTKFIIYSQTANFVLGSIQLRLQTTCVLSVLALYVT
jgi:hypothetical protein